MTDTFKKLVLFSGLLLGCSAMVSVQIGGGGEANPQLRTNAKSSKELKVKKARFLDGNCALNFRKEKSGIVLELPNTLPDSTVSVVVLELAQPLPAEVEKINIKF